MIQAGSLMVDTEKSSRSPFGSISAASIYYAESSGEFTPHQTTADAEGYSDVRHNRSRLSALDVRDSRELLGGLESRTELLNRAIVCPRFFLSQQRAIAVVKIAGDR